MAPLRTLLSIISRPRLSVFLVCGSLIRSNPTVPLKRLHTGRLHRRGAAGGAGGAGVPLRILQDSSHLLQPHCNTSQGKGAVHTQQFQVLIIKRLMWDFLLLLRIPRLMLFTFVCIKIWGFFKGKCFMRGDYCAHEAVENFRALLMFQEGRQDSKSMCQRKISDYYLSNQPSLSSPLCIWTPETIINVLLITVLICFYYQHGNFLIYPQPWY